MERDLEPQSSHRGRRPTAYRVILEPRKRKPASVRDPRLDVRGSGSPDGALRPEPRVVIGAMRVATAPPALAAPPAPSTDSQAVTLPRGAGRIDRPSAADRERARPAAGPEAAGKPTMPMLARPPEAAQIARDAGIAVDSAPGERLCYAPGDVLADRYRLLGPIGSGGMGSIWRARNLSLELDVALKLVRRGCWVPQASERLLREARAAARVAHPAAVRVFDYGVTSKGDPFFVMELLQGRPLSRALADSGTLAPLAAVQLLLPITGALVAAHREGIVHRDLKPANVLLVEDGRRVIPKLIDFGIACAERAWSRKLTSKDLRVGSPAYMAPEQLKGGDPDPRTDVWGICFMIYELVTGARPSRGENPLEPQKGDAPGLARLLDHPGLSSIVARGLMRSPADRWPTMGALSSALAEWALKAGAVWDVMRTSLAVYYAAAGDDDG